MEESDVGDSNRVCGAGRTARPNWSCWWRRWEQCCGCWYCRRHRHRHDYYPEVLRTNFGRSNVVHGDHSPPRLLGIPRKKRPYRWTCCGGDDEDVVVVVGFGGDGWKCTPCRNCWWRGCCWRKCYYYCYGGGGGDHHSQEHSHLVDADDARGDRDSHGTTARCHHHLARSHPPPRLRWKKQSGPPRPRHCEDWHCYYQLQYHHHPPLGWWTPSSVYRYDHPSSSLSSVYIYI